MTVGPTVDRACAHLSDQRIDWFRLIVELERDGYGATVVALSINVAKTTLLGWKQGSRPRYEDGDRLIALWSQVTGNSRETVPMVGRYSYRA